MGRERVFTIYTGHNPNLGDGQTLASELNLHPRDVSPVMGRSAMEIFIPEDKFQSILGVVGLNEGEKIIQQFTNLGYECEERQ